MKTEKKRNLEKLKQKKKNSEKMFLNVNTCEREKFPKRNSGPAFNGVK